MTEPNAVKEASSSLLGCLLRKHLAPLESERGAWIWFDWANSIYSTVCIATFLPLVLNSYATTAAWAQSDRVQPDSCDDINYATACIECRVGEGDLLCTGSGTGRENCTDLDVPLIGGLNPASFSFFIVSVSCISQLLFFAIFGLQGDYSNNRKTLLMYTSLAGSFSCICFAFFPIGEESSKYIWAAILTIVSNTLFGAAQIYYNAYLPLIAEDLHKQETQEGVTREGGQGDVENELSSKALAAGYFSGVLGLIFSIVILAVTGGLAEDASEYAAASSFRWTVVLSGVWWFFGTLLTVPRLQDRPGKEGNVPWTHTLTEFGKTISFTRTHLPETFKYMLLYFLYSDGFSTIAGLGIMYARLEMCATTTTLFVIAIEAPLCAGLGNYLFLWLSRKYQTSNLMMVVYILCFISVLPFWGLLGFVSDAIGFRNSWEAYLLGAYFGFCLGAVQNFSRTFFVEMIPHNRESEFFAFYELTDKGSSWLGPMVISAMANSGSTLRLGFLYIIIMTLGPAYLLTTIDIAKAKEDIAIVEKGTFDKIGDNEKGEQSVTTRDVVTTKEVELGVAN